MTKKEKEQFKQEILQEIREVFIEEKLINMIVNYPSRKETKKLVEKYIKIFEKKDY